MRSSWNSQDHLCEIPTVQIAPTSHHPRLRAPIRPPLNRSHELPHLPNPNPRRRRRRSAFTHPSSSSIHATPPRSPPPSTAAAPPSVVSPPPNPIAGSPSTDPHHRRRQRLPAGLRRSPQPPAAATDPLRRKPSRRQPSEAISKVVFGGQVTDEEFESLNKRKPCSAPKWKEMTGSGIFAAEGEVEEDESANASATPIGTVSKNYQKIERERLLNSFLFRTYIWNDIYRSTPPGQFPAARVAVFVPPDRRRSEPVVAKPIPSATNRRYKNLCLPLLVSAATPRRGDAAARLASVTDSVVWALRSCMLLDTSQHPAAALAPVSSAHSSNAAPYVSETRCFAASWIPLQRAEALREVLPQALQSLHKIFPLR
uniref:DUF4057 domain-containing protein n=1 Tax=Oryza glumipatula TaxID=40148 RepID=A0A0E0AFP2_9ORYZ